MQARLLRLDPIRDLDGYAALRRLAGTLGDAVLDRRRSPPRRRRDPETAELATRIDNLGLADWSLWRRGDEPSIADRGHQRGALRRARPRQPAAAAGALGRRAGGARAALGGAGRAPPDAHRRRRGPQRLPVSTDDPLLQAAADLGVLIAGEGRKFGLHLFVATQRPGKVHPNVVSQCDNLVLMRMNGAADVEELTTLFSHVPAPLIRRALGFGLGQALLAGPIRPIPLLAQIGARRTPEGGGDVPTTWAQGPVPYDGAPSDHD